MRIFYINNSGGGFANHIDMPDGTTVAQLFEQKMPGLPSRRLPDPRQPPARRGGGSARRRMPRLGDASEDRRRHGSRLTQANHSY